MNLLLDLEARPVIGHRGNRAYAPENTVEAFAQAVAAGAEGLEFDVRLSADGVPVVFHDRKVSRTTDGVGEVARMTFAELRRLDAGANWTADAGKSFPYRGAGHRIPAFEEVLEAFPTTPMIIEIKATLAATVVRKMLETRNAADRVLVDAYSPQAMRVFADSDIPVGATSADVVRLMSEVMTRRRVTPFQYRSLCVPLNYYGLPIPVRRFAKVAPAQNCTIHVWTLNDTAKGRSLWRDGIQGIITDDPAAMRAARAKEYGTAGATAQLERGPAA